MNNGMSPRLFEMLGNVELKKQLLTSIINVRPVITEDDVINKIKTRYFARYMSQRDGTIYELDNRQYELIENNSLFRKTTIDWVIRGQIEDTILTLPNQTNILVKGVISQNKLLVTLAQKELPGIINHLKNYVEFWAGE